MKVGLIFIGCGRWQYEAETWASFMAATCGYPWYEFIRVSDTKRNGGSWSIEQAWTQARESDADYWFHLEDDWTFNGRLDVDNLARILEADYNLANIVLRRQAAIPWEPEGGYIGANPHAFAVRSGYLEHRIGFWLNPCLYPAEIPRRYQWPAKGSEQDFTDLLLSDEPAWRFAVYGEKDSPPVVHHIGDRSFGWWGK